MKLTRTSEEVSRGLDGKGEMFYSSGWAACSRMPSMVRATCALHVTALGMGSLKCPGQIRILKGLKFLLGKRARGVFVLPPLVTK